MAKVWGPLHSDDARGKLADSMVFMGWKGIKTVRQWLKPTNPKREKQGNIRTIIGGLGRAVGKIVADSNFHDQLIDLDLIPDQQSKQSYLVQYIKDNYLAGGGATMTAAYVDQIASFAASDGYTSWTNVAVDLGVLDFSLDYDTIDDFNKGFGLFLIAKAAKALSFTGAPYTDAEEVISWTTEQIELFIADFTG